jgi:hypothetical protein
MNRSPARRRTTPSIAITPRHVWLATLGLAARSRRHALQLGDQAQANVQQWRVRLGTRAVGLEHVVREAGERLQGHLQPLLARVGLPQVSPATRSAAKPARRRGVSKPRATAPRRRA